MAMQDFSLSMYLRQQWNDSRLAFDPQRNNNSSKLKLGDEGWKRIWVPDVFFCNEKTASFHHVTTPNRLVFIHDNGRVWYVTKITATLSCPMKLHKYPLDTQGCPILFSSFDYSVETIDLRWIQPKDSAVQFDPGGEDKSQFIIRESVLQNCSYNKSDAYPPGEAPCLEVIFVVTRNLGYFLIQYYIPSILLVILSWVSFWISVDAVVARVNLGLLTVLTLTTQSTGSRDQLPRVSYVKAIDVWMSTCLVFAFASLIEFAIVNVWSRREARRAKNADMMSLKRALHSALPQPTTTTTTTTTATQRQQQQGHGEKIPQQQQRVCNACRKDVKLDAESSLPQPTIAVVADDTDDQQDDDDQQQQQQQQQARRHDEERVAADEAAGNSLTVPGDIDRRTSATSESSFASSAVSAPAAVNRRRSSTSSHVRQQHTSIHRRLSFQRMPALPIHAPRPVEHASTIDKLSRVLFPSSFFAFNLAYWLIYAVEWEPIELGH